MNLPKIPATDGLPARAVEVPELLGTFEVIRSPSIISLEAAIHLSSPVATVEARVAIGVKSLKPKSDSA